MLLGMFEGVNIVCSVRRIASKRPKSQTVGVYVHTVIKDLRLLEHESTSEL